MARVYVVDDSPTSRLALRRILEPRGHTVVGEASSGAQALRDIPVAGPDVVLMDVMMEGLDGIKTTEALLQAHPVPILVVSDLMGRAGDLSFRALGAGALDVTGKPGDPAQHDDFARRVALIAKVPVVTRRARRTPGVRPLLSHRRVSLVALGASTGGPPLVCELLGALPPTPPWPVLVVQHMAPGFTAGFADWLARSTRRTVTLARDGERPVPGHVYLAPEGRHLVFDRAALRLADTPPNGGFRPSVDALFTSLARSEHAPTCLAALLTGMGSDGAEGLRALRSAGALTIAQDEASSAVFGMPRAAIERGAAVEVLGSAELRARLVALAHGAGA